MSEMIERVALAICHDEIGLTFGPIASCMSATKLLEETGKESAEIYRRTARAAIAAMREPTETMLNAGEETEGRSVAAIVWRDMIDEALK